MPSIDVDGVGIAYEIIGSGSRPAVITPGGRYSKDIAGLRQLAEQLAQRDFRVVIWDRPNCGASDVCFRGETESIQNADALAGLLRALGMAPALLIGGSAGSRETLIAAVRSPDVVERVFVFWISGGPIGLGVLAFTYCHDSAVAAATGGMQAVVELPMWKDQIARNPENRARFLALDPAWFVEKMQTWSRAFIPGDDCPVPGLTAAQLQGLAKPVMVLRSSAMDVHHTRATSEAVHALIPGARIAEPPWGPREWPDRLEAAMRGESAALNWPMLAPQISQFA
jgi:pimeloyl-ACP methyl ester carboxylesterase